MTQPGDTARPNPRWLSVEDAATVLGLHRNTVYGLVRDGSLPHKKFGSAIRIPVSALEVEGVSEPEPLSSSATPQ